MFMSPIQGTTVFILNLERINAFQRYWKPIFENDSHEKLYRQSKKNFDNRQMYALKELYAWRDKISREEDESSG